jgi:hypothetical protein
MLLVSCLLLLLFFWFHCLAVRVVVFAAAVSAGTGKNIRLFGASSEYSSDEAFQVLKGPV